MHANFKELGLRASVALATLLPALSWAQANPSCGLPGLPPCPIPEPGSWPLVVLAVVAIGVVMRIRRK